MQNTTMIENADVDYCAFLLRLWREEGETYWRASLEDPLTGEKQGFANLNRLVKYLVAQTDMQINGECQNSTIQGHE